MLSTGDDLLDIELISFNTSSTVGGVRVLKNSPVCFGSAYRASVSLPWVDMRDRNVWRNISNIQKYFEKFLTGELRQLSLLWSLLEIFLILVMKKSASVSHRSLPSTGVNIAGGCVECNTSRITDHFRRGLESAARNRSVYSWRREFKIASLAVRQAARYFIRSPSSWWAFHFRSSRLLSRLASTAFLDNQWLSRLEGENLVRVCSGQWRSRTAAVTESSCSANCSAESAGAVITALIVSYRFETFRYQCSSDFGTCTWLRYSLSNVALSAPQSLCATARSKVRVFKHPSSRYLMWATKVSFLSKTTPKNFVSVTAV